ncbi:hypothetical protein HAZT_HAZT004592 [Hyalella azteca]|uniref:Uncharacterized protein n=1 Tax=Hyalella azteca TaxID=294128 RepID=A0A6A0H286_HYAAZ|nr:hypothetical protein HAZT_HAZT004592 [Hyalella azteca]
MWLCATCASNRNIPSGRHICSKPGLSKDIINLTQQRDNLHAADPTSDNVAALTTCIHQLTNDNKKARWKQYLSTFNSHTNINPLWSTIKALAGKLKNYSNIAINFNGKAINYIIKKLADRFNSFFTAVTQHRFNKLNRITTWKSENLNLLDSPSLSTVQAANAIKQSHPSRATGPDKLTIFHLKHLGPLTITYLSRLFN